MGPIVISAIYCPPKHNNKRHNSETFLNSLGHRYNAGGDWNAKQTQWDFRIVTTKGRELLAATLANKATYLSTGQPTHWPSDLRKLPDLLDFWIIQGISKNYFQVKSSFDLSSDHSPIIASLSSKIADNDKQPTLYNHRTNWEKFRELLDAQISLHISLKTPREIELATENLTSAVQRAARAATPPISTTEHERNLPLNQTENRR